MSSHEQSADDADAAGAVEDAAEDVLRDAEQMLLDLDELRHASAQVRDWETAQVETARTALRSGATVTEVAEAAGVTRQTIYRWRKPGASRLDKDYGGEKPELPEQITMRTSVVLNAALAEILAVGVGDQATTDDLVAGLNARALNVKARRIGRGTRAMTTPMRDLSDHARLAIYRGQLAASAVLSAESEGRALPKTVRFDRAE